MTDDEKVLLNERLVLLEQRFEEQSERQKRLNDKIFRALIVVLLPVAGVLTGMYFDLRGIKSNRFTREMGSELELQTEQKFGELRLDILQVQTQVVGLRQITTEKLDALGEKLEKRN